MFPARYRQNDFTFFGGFIQMSETIAADGFPMMKTVFSNTMDAFLEVMRETDAFMEVHTVSPPLAYAIRLALEELATNIIKYGYRDQNHHEIEVSLVLSAPAVMTLTDDGHPFNPLAEAPVPILDGPLENRPIGGLGLHMVQAMGMQLIYRLENGHNVLSIKFPEV